MWLDSGYILYRNLGIGYIPANLLHTPKRKTITMHHTMIFKLVATIHDQFCEAGIPAHLLANTKKWLWHYSDQGFVIPAA